MTSLSLIFLSVALFFLLVVALAIPSAAQAPPPPIQCMLQRLNVTQPFNLCARDPYCQVIKYTTDTFLIGYNFHRWHHRFEHIRFCFVLDDMECSLDAAECVQENIEYRIRVHKPYRGTADFKGYLHVKDSKLEVVPSFQEVSGFKLSNAGPSPADRVDMRITHELPDGQVQTLTNRALSMPVVFQNEKLTNRSQDFFACIAYNKVNSMTIFE